jgi:cell wall-associated NlpC family hydrolase
MFEQDQRLHISGGSTPKPAQVISPIAALLQSADPGARMVTQALLGERVQVHDAVGSTCLVQLQRDGYVGFMQRAALEETSVVPTHQVIVPSTFIYAGPDIKSSASSVPMLGQFPAVIENENFLKVADIGFIWRKHAALVTDRQADFVAVAAQFLHVPYLWGGKSFAGLDCSGLVQIALQAIGLETLRDTDMQEKSIGHEISRDNLRRGDLVFWKGHVGIMMNATQLLHANGFHMAVAIEPLAEAMARIKAGGSQVTSARRI